MKTLLARFLLVPAALVLTVATVHAQDLNSVKARIAQRLPQIDSSKASGALGENTRGFVEARSTGGDVAALISAENADREVVYAAIAKHSGTSAAVVGAARAKQIAAHSAPGVWLQAETGTWYQK